MSPNITIVDPTTGQHSELDVTFTDEEQRDLREFVRCAIELLNTDYFKLDRQASLKISGDEEAGITVEPYLPPKAVCDAMIFRLRPFLLVRERTFFNRVRNIVGRRVSHASVQALLASRCDEFEGKMFRSMLSVDDNLGPLNSDEAVMQYLNAHEYHGDADKRERLEPARQFLQDDGLRAFYLILLVEKARAVKDLAALIRVLLGLAKTVSFGAGKPSAPTGVGDEPTTEP